MGGLLPIFSKDNNKGLVDYKSGGWYHISGNIQNKSIKIFGLPNNGNSAVVYKFIILVSSTTVEAVIRFQNEKITSILKSNIGNEEIKLLIKDRVVYITTNSSSMFTLKIMSIMYGNETLLLEKLDYNIENPDVEYVLN